MPMLGVDGIGFVESRFRVRTFSYLRACALGGPVIRYS